MADFNYHGPVVVFDLDDTLYPERDYAISGYRSVAKKICSEMGDFTELDAQGMVEVMTSALDARKNPFNALYDRYPAIPQAGLEINTLVAVYRDHQPDIVLAPEVKELLDTLSGKGVKLGLITDGRSHSQRAKIRALGLERYFSPDDLTISEETGHDKHDRQSFVEFVHRYPEAKGFYYIGDNPEKDFLHPNLLGWTTICLLDLNGHNIHSQDFSKLTPMHQPRLKISNITDLLPLIT